MGKLIEKNNFNEYKKFQNSSMNENNFPILTTYVDSKPYGLKSKDTLTSIFLVQKIHIKV